jgi:uncharacterized protein
MKQKILWPIMLGLATLTACKSKEPAEATAPDAKATTTQLRFVSASGSTHTLQAEIALTPAAQERGLSHRAHISAATAMIFPMAPPRNATFWMKNTLVPLDMLFIRTDGRIDMIAASAKPNDLTPISNGKPVAGVVELVGGQASKMGLQVGDKVMWGSCASKSPAPMAYSATDFCP